MISHQRAGQAAATELRMDQHAHAADVPLPAAKLLVQGGHTGNPAVQYPQQRQIAAVINILAPAMDGLEVRDTVFDEHQLRRREFEKQLVQILLIIVLQRAQGRPRALPQRHPFRELLEFKFNTK